MNNNNTRTKRPRSEICNSEDENPAKRLKPNANNNHMIDQMSASPGVTCGWDLLTTSLGQAAFDKSAMISISYVQAKDVTTKNKDQLPRLILATASLVQNNSLLVSPRTSYYLVAWCANAKAAVSPEKTRNIVELLPNLYVTYTFFKMTLKNSKELFNVHFTDGTKTRSTTITISFPQEAKDTLSYTESHGCLQHDVPSQVALDDMAVSHINVANNYNSVVRNVFRHRYSAVILVPARFLPILDALLAPNQLRNELQSNILLYRSNSLTTHWCTLLATYETLDNQYFQDILLPATEIVMFFDHNQTEDIRWLSSITNQLHFKEKTHVCTSLQSIELQCLSPPAQLIVASLKQAQEWKTLPMGCFLVRQNLQDNVAVLHHAKLWRAAPYRTSDFDHCFCIVFEDQSYINPTAAARHVTDVITNQGYPTHPIGVCYSSIVVFFMAPASFRWLCTFQFNLLKQQFDERGLELKSITPATRQRLAQLMKMKRNEPFKNNLFDLFCRLELAQKYAAPPIMTPIAFPVIVSSLNTSESTTQNRPEKKIEHEELLEVILQLEEELERLIIDGPSEIIKYPAAIKLCTILERFFSGGPRYMQVLNDPYFLQYLPKEYPNQPNEIKLRMLICWALNTHSIFQTANRVLGTNVVLGVQLVRPLSMLDKLHFSLPLHIVAKDPELQVRPQRNLAGHYSSIQMSKPELLQTPLSPPHHEEQNTRQTNHTMFTHANTTIEINSCPGSINNIYLVPASPNPQVDITKPLARNVLIVLPPRAFYLFYEICSALKAKKFIETFASEGNEALLCYSQHRDIVEQVTLCCHNDIRKLEHLARGADYAIVITQSQDNLGYSVIGQVDDISLHAEVPDGFKFLASSPTLSRGEKSIVRALRHTRTALWMAGNFILNMLELTTHAIDTTLLTFPLVNSREWYLMLKFRNEGISPFTSSYDLFIKMLPLKDFACIQIKVSNDTAVLRSSFWVQQYLLDKLRTHRVIDHDPVPLLSVVPTDEDTAEAISKEPFTVLSSTSGNAMEPPTPWEIYLSEDGDVL